jgi:hypothetical protein
VSEPVFGVSLRALAAVLVDFVGITLNEGETIVAEDDRGVERRNPAVTPE